jgi:hypothetical protein
MRMIIISALVATNVAWAAVEITSYDEIYTTDGSVIKGTIIEKELGKLLLVETLDGRFSVEEAEIKIIREDIPLVYSEKSPALALALSMIFPGVGQHYSGRSAIGFLQEAMYITGVVVLVGGLDTPNNWRYRDLRRNKIIVGGSIYAASIIWTLIDAPLGAKRATKRNREKAYTEAISE